MNPIAKELNAVIEAGNPYLFEMLSDIGRKLFFPKGILSQSAEAKEKAHTINATIGIAKEGDEIMHFPSVMGLIEGLEASESLTYAPSFGIPGLRKKWQAELRVKNPGLADKEISLPVVTCGITHAISIFADVWTDPGDTVLLPDMMWGNYNMILSVRKGVNIAHFPLFNDQGGFNLEGFEAKAKELAQQNGKLIVLLNFPQNPTGYSATEKEGQALADILTGIAENGANVIAVCDDAYFGLFYEDEVMKESLFAKICGRHPRLLPIKLDGATKENYVWGLRVGFITYGCAAEKDLAGIFDALEKKTAGCIRGNISNASHLSQTITLKSLQSDAYQAEKKEKFDILKRRATRVKEVVYDPKYAGAWDVYPFNSGYFMCIRLKNVNAEKLRVHLLNKYGVGLISIGDHDLRVAFSCIREKDVELLFDTILKGVNDIS